METQFTPGPWHVNSPYIEDQHGTIAKVMRPEETAALIAAAPELLEALNALYETALTGNPIPLESSVMVTAILAIAKAKGE